MGVVRLWERFGRTILAEPKQTLAAYFGHQRSVKSLSDAGLGAPTFEDMEQEGEFNPNPHKLDLPDEYLQTSLLVRSLALWGREPLTRAAIACAEHQIVNQTQGAAALVNIRDAARNAAVAFITTPDLDHRERARIVVAACQAAYRPFEDRPDDDAAAKVWYQLGAPWFAAETVSQDFSLSEWDGPGPPGASATWGNRNSVWPERAADAAAHWSSLPDVRKAIQVAILAWALGERD